MDVGEHVCGYGWVWVSMCVGMDGCRYGWVWVWMCVGVGEYVCGYGCMWVWLCRYGCMWVWVGVDVCGCLGELGKRDIFSDMIICITDIFF